MMYSIKQLNIMLWREEYTNGTATESSYVVEKSAGEFVEDGLGADRLNRKFRSSGCTRYSARVLMVIPAYSKRRIVWAMRE